MVFVIGNVLNADGLATLQEAADRLDYQDGRKTAGRYARGVKSNQQGIVAELRPET